MGNTIPIYAIIMILLIIVRCSIEQSPYVVTIVAAINIIALLMVVFSLTIQIKERVAAKIAQSLPRKRKARLEGKIARRWIDSVTYITFGVAALIYIIWFKSGLGNDIIAIIALCLSLCDEYIVAGITDLWKV